jgi:hypothetical protein
VPAAPVSPLAVVDPEPRDGLAELAGDGPIEKRRRGGEQSPSLQDLHLCELNWR